MCFRLWSSGCRSRYQGAIGRFKFLRRPFCIIGQYQSNVATNCMFLYSLYLFHKIFASNTFHSTCIPRSNSVFPLPTIFPIPYLNPRVKIVMTFSFILSKIILIFSYRCENHMYTLQQKSSSLNLLSNKLEVM